jgi:hypothetical protein
MMYHSDTLMMVISELLNLKLHYEFKSLFFKFVKSYFFINLFFLSFALSAIPTSYTLHHPISWMHLMPVGETPGWESRNWIHSELSHGNVWNAPITLFNNSNNKTLTYQADYSQTHLILEVGGEFSKSWAHSLVIPYAYRGGDGLDSFIDDFHTAFGFDRFNRNQYPEDQSHLSVNVNGEEIINDNSASGISNIKYKIKYWPWQLKGQQGQCACGFALSGQAKIPMDGRQRGLSTGYGDYSLLWHLGIPIFSNSAIWLTSAVTRTEQNPYLEDFPRKKWHQMYELSTEWGLSNSWSFTFQVRMESPFLEKDQLEIVTLLTDQKSRIYERVSSGWNSLVHWRGSESFGFKYTSRSKNQQLLIQIIEDWALGNFDETGDDFYVNNAPDVGFSIQYNLNFN